MKVKIYSIYKITNSVDGKTNIGFTKKDPYKRFIEHKSAAKTMAYRYFLHKAMRKYGEDAFSLEIVWQSLDCEYTLSVMEPFFIRETKSYISDGGYNMTFGGQGGMLGRHHSEETRKKISKPRTKTWYKDATTGKRVWQ